MSTKGEIRTEKIENERGTETKTKKGKGTGKENGREIERGIETKTEKEKGRGTAAEKRIALMNWQENETEVNTHTSERTRAPPCSW